MVTKHLNHNCRKYKPTEDLNQMTLGDDSSKGTTMIDGDVRTILVAKAWSQEACVKSIVEFTVIDEQPFSIVEKRGFRRMMDIVQPRLYVPSRRSIAREFWKMYDHLKDSLARDLRKYRVSFTTYTWTSVQNINYMVLTAHFVDDNWVMHKRILNFCQIQSHRGVEIGKLIEQCLVEWKIEKVMCISIDNVAANRVAIDWVVRKMKSWPSSPLILLGKYIHVRCLAHVSNVIVKDGLQWLEGSVASIRKAVKFVKSSPSRFEYFKKCILSEKIDDGGFVIMDVPPRWNSTYLMLETAMKF
ncbi:cellulase [Ranunculus cassubicifolius]